MQWFLWVFWPPFGIKLKIPNVYQIAQNQYWFLIKVWYPCTYPSRILVVKVYVEHLLAHASYLEGSPGPITDRISLQMEERRGMESTLLAWIYYQRERNKEKVTTIVALTCTSWFCVGQGGGWLKILRYLYFQSFIIVLDGSGRFHNATCLISWLVRSQSDPNYQSTNLQIPFNSFFMVKISKIHVSAEISRVVLLVWVLFLCSQLHVIQERSYSWCGSFNWF